jgi:hypothetical protein
MLDLIKRIDKKVKSLTSFYLSFTLRTEPPPREPIQDRLRTQRKTNRIARERIHLCGDVFFQIRRLFFSVISGFSVDIYSFQEHRKGRGRVGESVVYRELTLAALRAAPVVSVLHDRPCAGSRHDHVYRLQHCRVSRCRPCRTVRMRRRRVILCRPDSIWRSAATVAAHALRG